MNESQPFVYIDSEGDRWDVLESRLMEGRVEVLAHSAARDLWASVLVIGESLSRGAAIGAIEEHIKSAKLRVNGMFNLADVVKTRDGIVWEVVGVDRNTRTMTLGRPGSAYTQERRVAADAGELTLVSPIDRLYEAKR